MLKLNALWSRLNKLGNVVFGAPPKSYTMNVTDDMTGRAMSSDGRFVKITNDAPNPMIGWMVSGKSPEGDSFSFVVGQDGEGSDTIDDSGMFWGIGGGYVVYVAGATVEETIFPEVGVYFPVPSAMEEEGITSVTLTAPTADLNGAPFVMQDGKPVWGAPINPKFLPEGVGGGDLWINLTDYGIGLMTTFFDESDNPKDYIVKTVTEEQFFDLVEKVRDTRFRGFYCDVEQEDDTGAMTYARSHFYALQCGLSPAPMAFCISYDMLDEGKIELWRIGCLGDELILAKNGSIAFATE